MKLKVISLITHHNGYSKLLEKHLKENKIKYKFLGYKKKWKGWKWRMDLIKQELLKTNSKKYIVAIIDGFDVLMFDDEKTIIEKYKKCNKDIVLSLNTFQKDSNQIVISITKYLNRLANGGIYIGNPNKIAELFDKVYKNFLTTDTKEFDDEIELNNFLKNIENKEYIEKTIHFDRENDLVYTSNPGHYMFYSNKFYDIVDNKIERKIYNSSFIHTIGHYDKDIIKTFNLESKHRYYINLKTFMNDTKYLNILLLIFVVFLIIILS